MCHLGVQQSGRHGSGVFRGLWVENWAWVYGLIGVEEGRDYQRGPLFSPSPCSYPLPHLPHIYRPPPLRPPEEHGWLGGCPQPHQPTHVARHPWSPDLRPL